ncbi:MAG: 30S ribosomal protein S17 [Legionellales bacterium]|nr:30S ribosomal protein S17 [Legionellales bacterium]|tara:strand:- start:2504 stop:2758 length:255 start_codon:yes stop_codon:yes gene_type:complete
MLRVIKGEVVKKSSDKTIKVRVDRKTKHPVVGKYITRCTYYQVHDEHNQAEVGQMIGIAEGRKVSKSKTWHLVPETQSTAEVGS